MGDIKYNCEMISNSVDTMRYEKIAWPHAYPHPHRSSLVRLGVAEK